MPSWRPASPNCSATYRPEHLRQLLGCRWQCPVAPFIHEGAGPCQGVREDFRTCAEGVVLKERARASKEPGSTLAKPSEGLGVDAGDERRILRADDAL